MATDSQMLDLVYSFLRLGMDEGYTHLMDECKVG